LFSVMMRRMSTKSRQSTSGASVRAATERAKEARKEADSEHWLATNLLPFSAA
jgi:hypothetical protein